MREVTKTIGLTITAIDIQKGVDDGTGFVYLDAVGADETPDIDGEIFDYISSKPYVKAWSAEATMHGMIQGNSSTAQQGRREMMNMNGPKVIMGFRG